MKVRNSGLRLGEVRRVSVEVYLDGFAHILRSDVQLAVRRDRRYQII